MCRCSSAAVAASLPAAPVAVPSFAATAVTSLPIAASPVAEPNAGTNRGAYAEAYAPAEAEPCQLEADRPSACVDAAALKWCALITARSRCGVTAHMESHRIQTPEIVAKCLQSTATRLDGQCRGRHSGAARQ